jgi:hypothetical protein
MNMKDRRLYNKIRKVFREHFRCAFREDVTDARDCLVYMAEVIGEYVAKNYEKKHRNSH